MRNLLLKHICFQIDHQFVRALFVFPLLYLLILSYGKVVEVLLLLYLMYFILSRMHGNLDSTDNFDCLICANNNILFFLLIIGWLLVGFLQKWMVVLTSQLLSIHICAFFFDRDGKTTNAWQSIPLRVTPSSEFTSPRRVLNLTTYLTSKMLMHVAKNYTVGFVFKYSF